MDIAVVGVGASVILDGNTVTACRIALASVAPTPVYATSAAASLVGQEISEENITAASEAAQASATPISDMRGTAEYRTHLIGVLTRRALHCSIQRAKEA